MTPSRSCPSNMTKGNTHQVRVSLAVHHLRYTGQQEGQQGQACCHTRQLAAVVLQPAPNPLHGKASLQVWLGHQHPHWAVDQGAPSPPHHQHHRTQQQRTKKACGDEDQGSQAPEPAHTTASTSTPTQAWAMKIHTGSQDSTTLGVTMHTHRRRQQQVWCALVHGQIDNRV